MLRLAGQAPKGIGTLKIAGRPVPQAMNTWCGEDPVICRIAPDTWLLFSALHEAPELLDAVRTACAQEVLCHHGPVRRLRDPCARRCARGGMCSLAVAAIDFAPNAFGPDACARTRLAQLPVVVRRVTAERFECVVDRSAAQYLFDWMQDAAAGLD